MGNSGYRVRLVNTAGVTGAAAKALIPGLADIYIDWPLAEVVFNEVTLTRFYQLTQRTYPGFDQMRKLLLSRLPSTGAHR